MLTVKTLALTLFFAMTTWVPPREQTLAWGEPEAHATGRYWDFAEDVARVALDPDELPVEDLADDDDQARARTATVLASIASFESAFAEAVVTCKKLGPGRAKGPFQCEGKPCREVCVDVTHAARVALSMVRQSFDACAGELADRLAFYTDGKCPKRWQRSRVRYARAERWWKGHPLAWAEGLREQWNDLD